MNNTKLGTTEAIFIVLTICIAHYILSFPQNILYELKSSALLNVAFVSIIAILLSVLIVKLFKKFPGRDILDISEFLAGKTFKTIIGIIFISYFIISSSVLLRHFCKTLRIIYFPNTDILYLILLFVIAIIMITRLPNNSSFKANLVIVPLTIMGIVFIFLANINDFSFDRLFPILGTGFYDTFVLGIGNLASFAGLSIIYFLPPMLKEPNKFKKIGILTPIVCSGLFLTVILILLTMFSFFVNSEEIMPLYSAARSIEFGTFFQRLESIFLFVWIMLFASYCSIAIKFSTHILKKLTNLKDSKIIISVFGLILFALAMLVPNYPVAKFYESSIFKYIILIFVILFNILVLILANLKLKKKAGNSYNE